MLPLRSSLLVLGLAAPMASNAASLNLLELSQYASQEQVTSINQFSDVKPTDWAYQALSSLIERCGCPLMAHSQGSLPLQDRYLLR